MYDSYYSDKLKRGKAASSSSDSDSDSSNSDSDSESSSDEKQKKLKKSNKRKKLKKKAKKKKKAESEEEEDDLKEGEEGGDDPAVSNVGEISAAKEPAFYSSIRPEDLPPEPTNNFLRRGSPMKPRTTLPAEPDR